jgi:hypothetical protein
MARRKHRLVGTDQMVPADPITQDHSLGGAEPLAMAGPSTNGHLPAARPDTGDDYWARALGKSSVPPVAPPPAAVRRRSNDIAQRPPDGAEPASDTAASYWDRARGAAPSRPVRPERPAALALPAAAVSVAPEAAQDLPVRTEDTVVVSAVLAASLAPVPTEGLAAAQPESGVRGAHARQEDTLAVEVRGAHVKADDPLVDAACHTHLAEDEAVSAGVRGAHVMAHDPLAAEVIAAHAVKADAPVEASTGVEGAKAEAKGAEQTGSADGSAGHDAQAKPRRRRWPLVPVAGAAAALAAGLGGGGAYAYFTSTGSGTGHATTGSLVGVTVAALTGGDSPTTKLLPGGSADVILRVNNTNAFPVTLVSVTGGPATITVSGGSGCTLANSGVSFVNQSGLSVSIGASGTTLVDLPGAATMTTSSFTGCQNATFNIPVSITVQK